MAHAYFATGEAEAAIARARSFAETELGRPAAGNPDIIVLQHGLFAVEDARRLLEVSQSAPSEGDRKFVIVSATRLFHEAQNALLKLFEEPPQGVTLILVIPTEGMLLPTLRSRLSSLPIDNQSSGDSSDTNQGGASELTHQFLAATSAEREKLIAKLIDRTKSDKDEEKQAARNDAVQLIEGIVRAYAPAFRAAKSTEEREDLGAFLADLTHFLPLLHTRSAPLKLILEHVRLTWPKGKGK